MKYIDADALIKKLYPLGMGDGNYGINAKAVRVAIDGMATADVVEVVRCENCIYKGENIDTSGTVLQCDLRDESPVAVLYNDYCSYGTRKDGD